MAYEIMQAEEGDTVKFEIDRGTIKYLHPDINSATVEFIKDKKPFLRGFDLGDLEWHQEEGYGYWQSIE